MFVDFGCTDNLRFSAVVATRGTNNSAATNNTTDDNKRMP
jgi:hypothetical protein